MDREEFAAKEGVCLCLFAGGGVRHARSPENSWEGLGPFHEKQGGGHAGPHPQPDTSQCTVCLRTDGIPMLYTHTDSKLIRDAIIAIILFFFFLALLQGLWVLRSPAWPLGSESTESSHWTTREFPLSLL